ncbi:MAG: keto-deoxy-phosphogluconate aldolase [SAR116 cluster bacterium]|nr:keto-deoxy-phosphogluconate aldolase [SAR116 cluster bacterium]RPG93291.1 MAG: bifunctional 4-hydroxy-2-oxoglutarate aldolase/2-dehydro-3-deoxy-phosphogluconate aldolase [Candidatus Puniceispirillum sp. TMED213]
MTIHDILKLGPVMPVIVIDSADKAELLADALLAGGIRTAEITLRTPAAIKAIEKMARNCPDITVGAGTVRTARDAQIAADAGSRFVVSPGTTSSILEGCQSAGLPLLPGAASVSEMMALAEQGYSVQKFFPANAAGGISFIKSLSSPLPDLTFCPTGGITEITAPDWLALPNIVCVGGSWIAPQALIESGDFAKITNRARVAAHL